MVLPRPGSGDDDEDSSPLALDLEGADPVPCSKLEVIPTGHCSNYALTQVQGTYALPGINLSNSGENLPKV